MACLVVAQSSTRAQEYPAISDRDYAIDLQNSAVLGSARIVGMGGAAIAAAEGSAGALANPAAPASRAATSTERWDWDWHIDWLTPSFGSDFDNNGIEDEPSLADGAFGSNLVTAGLVVQYEAWAFAVIGTTTQSGAPVAEGSDEEIDILAESVSVLVSRGFLDDQLVLGTGIRVGRLALDRPDGRRAERIFSIAGSGLETGAIWRPRGQRWRVGSTLRFPVAGDTLETAECDPLDCMGYILPERVHVPWEAGVGVAYRFAKSPWNQTVDGDYRDEKSVLCALDLIATGPAERGHGIEAFARRQLQPSGRSTDLSLRAGVEYEWLPGRLRLRGGTYWEASRFIGLDGAPIPGRLHATLGVEVRVWSFRLWGDPYRVRLTLTADGADGYGNSGLSIGFWH